MPEVEHPQVSSHTEMAASEGAQVPVTANAPKNAPKNDLLVIRFKDVNVTATHNEPVTAHETFGKKLLGCFFGLCIKLASDKKKPPSQIHVLKDISGYVMPGTSTLLLGPPGSGRTTFLKVIEGKLLAADGVQQEGVVLYNSNELTTNIMPKKPIAYIGEQRNVHLPVFTVRETLEFAQACFERTDKQLLSLGLVPAELLQTDNPHLEYVLRSFGLKDIENKRVGSVADGIKDGERIRLTLAEVAMGTHSVVLFDHPSTSQDPLITYDIVRIMRDAARVLQIASMLAMSQVTPEIYDLFDRVVLLSEGHIIFQGPPFAAERYFSELGFNKPPHVDIGAFLNDIAGGNGIWYLQEGFPLVSTTELANHYTRSEHHKEVLRIVNHKNVISTFWAEAVSSGLVVSMRGRAKGADLIVEQSRELGRSTSFIAGDKITGVCKDDGETEYIGTGEQGEASKVAELLDAPSLRRSASVSVQVERRLDEHGDIACRKRKFGRERILEWWLPTKELIKRQAKCAIRLKELLLLRFIQVTIIGIFMGTLYFHKGGKIDQFDISSVRSIGFSSMVHLLLINVVQVPVHILVHRPVFYKQKAQHLFGASSYVFAQGVVNLPQSLLEAFVYTICVYFGAKLSRQNASYYFEYWIVLFFVAYLGSWYMLLVGAISPVLEVATSLAGLLVVFNVLFSGFPIMLNVIRVYWKWMLYIIPTRWGNVIFSSTQIGDHHYKVPCSSVPTFSFCIFYPRLSVGDAFLKFFSLQAGGTSKLVLAYFIIIIFTLGVCLLTYLAYRKVDFSERPRSFVRREMYSTTDELNVPEAKPSDVENGGVSPQDAKWTSNLPVVPVTLTFRKLNFTRKGRPVLSNISGYAKPGSMLGILGSTHSGKKTLLKCISGRAPSWGKLECDLRLNGLTTDSFHFCRVVGFVDRQELHQPFLTVRESVEFHAVLRLGRSASPADRALHIDSVLQLMSLSGVGGHLTGTLHQSTGRSKEVYKKLSIAVELAANPSLLFLEDPTSALDSSGARSLLRLLHRIARGGRTVVTTLDHPSAEGIRLLDHVLLLRLGGQQAYFGAAEDMLDRFASVQGAPLPYDGGAAPKDMPVPAAPLPYDDCAAGFSPLTRVLCALGGGVRQRQPVVVDCSPPAELVGAELDAELDTDGVPPDVAVPTGLPRGRYRYPAPYMTQMAMVFVRNQRVLWRNVQYTFTRLSASLAVGLLMGTIYWRLNLGKLLPMSAASILPYMQAILIAGVISNNVILQLGTDKAVYRRENRSRMYAPVLYPLSWAVAELPYLLLATLAFVAAAGAMSGIGVRSAPVFFKYWLGLFAFSVAITYYGIFVTLLCRHPLLAVSVVSISSSVWISAAGVSVPRSKMGFYKWLYWVDPVQYAVNILTSVAFYCDTSSPACLACRAGAACPGCSCKRLGDVEARLALTGRPARAVFVWDRLRATRFLRIHHVGRDFGILFSMAGIFLLLSLLVFRLRHLRKRRSL